MKTRYEYYTESDETMKAVDAKFNRVANTVFSALYFGAIFCASIYGAEKYYQRHQENHDSVGESYDKGNQK